MSGDFSHACFLSLSTTSRSVLEPREILCVPGSEWMTKPCPYLAWSGSYLLERCCKHLKTSHAPLACLDKIGIDWLSMAKPSAMLSAKPCPPSLSTHSKASALCRSSVLRASGSFDRMFSFSTIFDLWLSTLACKATMPSSHNSVAEACVLWVALCCGETLTGFWARVRGCSESSSWKPLPQRENRKEREREIEAFTGRWPSMMRSNMQICPLVLSLELLRNLTGGTALRGQLPRLEHVFHGCLWMSVACSEFSF